MTTTPTADLAPQDPGIELFGSRYALVKPSVRDPRTHVAAVLVSVQVLGQTVLKFDVSIAQILLTIALCAVIEIPMVMWHRRRLAWPASALLTGNGIALLLRTPGTEWGDWWSLNGWPVFVAAASIAMFSKYAIRMRGRHIFNPSNLGLVVVFLLFGSRYADPQELWWGPWSPGLYATVVLLVVGGITLSVRMGLFDIVIAFWATFATGIAVLAFAGHAMVARWSLTPVEGGRYWWILVTSPELIIFAIFMITDPPTTPDSRRARIAYAVGIGGLAAVLSATQTTEFGTKVALLAALTLMCALRPVLERVFADTPAEIERATSRRALPLTVVFGGFCWIGALVLLSNLTSSSLEPTVASTAVLGVVEAGERPDVELPGSLPEVTIRDNVLRTATVDDGVADRLMTEVASDLVIQSEALRTGDPQLARTAAFGPNLVDLIERIESNTAAGTREEHIVEIDSAELVLLRDPISPQAIPQLGLDVAGELTTVLYSDADATRIRSSETVSFGRVFLATEIGGHWLIGAEMDPTDPMVTGT